MRRRYLFIVFNN